MSLNGGPVVTLFFGFGLAPLRFDSSNIYFSQEVAIHRMVKNGSPAISWTAPGAITALHADINNGRVYWGEHGGFVRSIFDGGAINTCQAAQALRQITSVGFDGARVLWTNYAVPGPAEHTGAAIHPIVAFYPNANNADLTRAAFRKFRE